MSRISEEVVVDVPVRVAYDQWTQFETFPEFMEGVEQVVQLDDRTLEWTAEVGGKTKRWRAEIGEQQPDQIISWRSVEGARNDGSVRFEPQDPERTRVMLEMDVEPDGLVESFGDAFGVVERQVRADLGRFKEFIERRDRATGAWRGSVEGGRVEGDDAPGHGTGLREPTGAGRSAGGTGRAS